MEPEQIIDDIICGLRIYPNIEFHRNKPHELQILGSGRDGFNIQIYTGYREHLIYLDDFHWHFGNNEQENTEMHDLIIKALFGKIRIQILAYNGTEFKWILQRQEDGNWIDEMITGTFNRNFHRTPNIYYRQNSFSDKDS